ncbi:hypothetical protein [Dyadobacter tibetensis]|uniref:hypothetical protein n=1 Tax=Dyadobacter tibetensis TaxID=1211851 RepID=UPI00046E9BA5|nr:hypothetical protein [Dyadobacter tibetensis]
MLKITPLLGILWFTLGSLFAQPADKLTPDKRRALQWKPEKGQYYFGHKLIYDYDQRNEGRKGTLEIGLDLTTGTLCFLRETSFGQTASDFDFILGFADGKFISCGLDEAGKKFRIKQMVVEVKSDPETLQQRVSDFQEFCTPTGSNKVIYGWPALEYVRAFPRSETSDKMWLLQTPFSVTHLYGFELMEGTASLPVSFDFIDLLGKNQLLMSYESKEVNIQLNRIEASPVTVNISPYREIIIAD